MSTARVTRTVAASTMALILSDKFDLRHMYFDRGHCGDRSSRGDHGRAGASAIDLVFGEIDR
jgi:purine nucleoside permease